MKFTKNRKFDINSDMVLAHYPYALIVSVEETERYFIPNKVKPEIIEWLEENIGEPFQPHPIRSWVASSIVNRAFYFTKKDDAMYFKLTWE